jgi:hypothetical protein
MNHLSDDEVQKLKAFKDKKESQERQEEQEAIIRRARFVEAAILLGAAKDSDQALALLEPPQLRYSGRTVLDQIKAAGVTLWPYKQSTTD